MDKVTFKNANGVEMVLPVPKDSKSEDWNIVVDEKQKPDRSKYVEERFDQDFPEHKGTPYKTIGTLASRSKAIQDWLRNINVEFSALAQTPLFYQDYLGAEKYQELKSDVSKANVKLKKLRKEYSDKVAEVKKELSEIEGKMSEVWELSTTSVPFRILTMDSTELPLTLQLAIENYTPADKETGPNQRRFAKEMLVRYKLLLLENFGNSSLEDLNKFVSENLKF